MTERRVTDGVRIAQLLSSEVHGRTDGVLAHVAVANADRDVAPTLDGARAYDVVFGRDPLVSVPERDVDVLDVDDATDADPADATVLASVFVQPERVRVAFRNGVAVAADAASGTRLRVRPKATESPRTLVFVESGAAVKDAADVVEAVVEAMLDDETGSDT
jgi:hypothetical protein